MENENEFNPEVYITGQDVLFDTELSGLNIGSLEFLSNNNFYDARVESEGFGSTLLYRVSLEDITKLASKVNAHRVYVKPYAIDEKLPEGFF